MGAGEAMAFTSANTVNMATSQNRMFLIFIYHSFGVVMWRNVISFLAFLQWTKKCSSRTVFILGLLTRRHRRVSSQVKWALMSPLWLFIGSERIRARAFFVSSNLASMTRMQSLGSRSYIFILLHFLFGRREWKKVSTHKRPIKNVEILCFLATP